MMRILSIPEAKKISEENDKFLLSLDDHIKSSLVHLLQPLVKQLYCEHEWIDFDSYENQMPKDSKYCTKCQLIAKK